MLLHQSMEGMMSFIHIMGQSAPDYCHLSYMPALAEDMPRPVLSLRASKDTFRLLGGCLCGRSELYDGPL